MRGGWYLVAFESELTGPITPVEIGDISLILVAGGAEVRAYDARCPHQGAHLGYGGTLHGPAVECPFHGRHIGLGADAGGKYCVREYPTIGYGGMLFTRLEEAHAYGLVELLDDLVESHVFVTFNITEIAVEGEYVIENAFDSGHFRTVHGVRNTPRFALSRTPAGAFVADGHMEVPSTPWHVGAAGEVHRTTLHARAFSPSLIFSHVGGANPYWVITGTKPEAHGCSVRQALAIPADDGAALDAERVKYLANASIQGLEQDRLIWERLRRPAHPRYEPEDAAVAAFREFCAEFEPSAS